MTWKLPRGNHRFSYSSLPPRARSPYARKPNPFGSAKPHIGRFNSWNGAIVGGREGTPPNSDETHFDYKPRASTSSPTLILPASPTTEEPGRMMSSGAAFETRPLVTNHEKHPPWDDCSRLDRPYDNPYYARPIENHLWLPRDPIGLLDLDDTVDVFKALTTDSSLGQLGEWMEEGIALNDLPASLRSSEQSIQEAAAPTRVLTGEEEILLPALIADRVENIHMEDDVQDAVESPSSYFSRPRRPSNATTTTRTGRRSTFSVQRPSTFDAPVSLRLTTRTSTSRFSPRTPTSALPSARQRSMTVSIDPAAEPDLFAQARFVQDREIAGLPAIRNMPFQPSDLSLPNTQHQAVTTREAVVGEVMEQERQATENRLRAEEASIAEPRTPTRSWWRAWVFSQASEPPVGVVEEKPGGP